jgi:hypothetical protein
MAVGTEGFYRFQFSVGDLDDFIEESELVNFTLIEEAGNALPTFEIAFNTSNEEVLNLLHEGNDLNVTFGKDRSDSTSAPLAITRLQTNKAGDSKRLISAVGMFSALPYIANSKILLSSKKSAIEVIKDVVTSFGFQTNFNVSKSNDSQVWIQHNISGKKFVNDLWMRSDLGDSFPAVGISSDGTFILKDIKKDLKDKKAPLDQPYSWRFTKEILTDRDIPFEGNPSIDLNTGFLNAWMGYGRERTVYNMEDGNQENVFSDAEPILAISNDMSRRLNVIKRYASTAIVNENVHANYWKSYHHNLVHLASFGNVKTTISFANLFAPIKVLDQVIFKDDDLISNKKSSSEFNSGIYYVAKVARNICHRQFVTTVVLCRESLNAIRNI